jgi:CelD/BcsL family acetyltransferase involved in cellulose biosynthesis
MTDYNAAILAPDLDPPAAHAALWRAAVAGGAELARRTHVVPGSPTDRFLAARGGHAAPGETSWAVDLDGTDGGSWIAGLSVGLRRNFQRYTRKLEGEGVGFWVWSPGEPIGPFLEALVAQKRAWFHRTGQRSFLDGPAGPAFLEDAAARMVARRALHLSALRLGDRFVACMLSFRGRRTLYAYTVSRDEAWNQFGPGQLLFMHLIRWCADQGIARVDLLGGDHDFKPCLGCRPTRLHNHVLPCSPVGRAALAVRRLGREFPHRPWPETEAARLPQR